MVDLKYRLISKSLEKKLKDISCKICMEILRINEKSWDVTVNRNFTLRDEEISFTPKGKITVVRNEHWGRSTRTTTKIGKGLRKILMLNPDFKYSDAELEVLVNKLKSCERCNFRIVKGSDIAKWYHYTMYADEPDGGNLWESCMRDMSDDSIFDIYTKNTDVVSMVILLNDRGELIGRALVWNYQGMWMDRIYGTDSTTEAFKRYAKSNGWNHKYMQSSDNLTSWMTPNGEIIEKVLEIPLDADFEQYPYLDTFRWTDHSSIITNAEDAHRYVLDEANGEYSILGDDDEIWDNYMGEYINSEDAVYVDSREIRTHVDNCVLIDGEYFVADDVVETFNGEYAYRDDRDLIYLNYIDCYEFYTNCIMCEYDHEYYLDTHVEYIEELSMQVYRDNIQSAFENEGYEQNESGDWVKIEELETV